MTPVLGGKFGRLAINVVVFMWPIKVGAIVFVLLMLFSQHLHNVDVETKAQRAEYFASGGVEYARAECEVYRSTVRCKKGE